MNIVIGNIIMTVASIIMVCIGLLKTKKQVLWWQSLQIGLMAVASLFLGTIPGFIADIIGIVRNVLSYKSKLNKVMQVLLSLIAVICILAFNNIGWLGLLPMAAAVTYTLAINTQNVKTLKIVLLLTMIMWAVHDFAVQSYVSCAFDIFSAITCVIGILRKEKTDGNTANSQN